MRANVGIPRRPRKITRPINGLEGRCKFPSAILRQAAVAGQQLGRSTYPPILDDAYRVAKEQRHREEAAELPQTSANSASPGKPSGKLTIRAVRANPCGFKSFSQRRKKSAALPRRVAGQSGSGRLIARPPSGAICNRASSNKKKKNVLLQRDRESRADLVDLFQTVTDRARFLTRRHAAGGRHRRAAVGLGRARADGGAGRAHGDVRGRLDAVRRPVRARVAASPRTWSR